MSQKKPIFIAIERNWISHETCSSSHIKDENINLCTLRWTKTCVKESTFFSISPSMFEMLIYDFSIPLIALDKSQTKRF